MTSPSPSPRSSGQFVRVGQTLPPIEVDCSDWPREPGTRSSGQFERVCETLPPVEADASRTSEVFLELTFTLTADADAHRLFGRVVKLFKRVDEYEKSLGGAGIRWDGERSGAKPGTLYLILTPNNAEDAEQRLEKLAMLVAGAVAEFPSVNAVLARGCRATEPDRPFFEIREVAA